MKFASLALALLALGAASASDHVFSETNDDRVFHGSEKRREISEVKDADHTNPDHGATTETQTEKEEIGEKVPCNEIDPMEEKFCVLAWTPCKWENDTCVDDGSDVFHDDGSGSGSGSVAAESGCAGYYSSDCVSMDEDTCNASHDIECQWNDDDGKCEKVEDEECSQPGINSLGYTEEEGNMGADGFWASNFGYVTDEYGFQHPAGFSHDFVASTGDDRRPEDAQPEGYSKSGPDYTFTPTEEDNSHVKGFRGDVGYHYAGPDENPFKGMSLEEMYEDPSSPGFGVSIDISCWTVLWNGDYWWTEHIWDNVYLKGKCYVKFWIDGCGFGFDGGAGLYIHHTGVPEIKIWIWEGPTFNAGTTYAQIQYYYPSEWVLKVGVVIKGTRYYPTACEEWGFKWWNIEFQIKIYVAGAYIAEISGTFWSMTISFW